MACFGSDTSHLLQALLLNCEPPMKRKFSHPFFPASADRLGFKKCKTMFGKYEIEEVIALDFEPEVWKKNVESMATSTTSSPPIQQSRFEDDVVDSKIADIITLDPSFDPLAMYRRLEDFRDNGDDHGSWSAKYAPRRSDDVLGNREAIHTLRSWLVEWKAFIEKDSAAAKKRRRIPRLNRKKGSSKPSSSSDSDGSYEDAAPDEMDIRAFIVHGPPGVGKTTAIHALARELSFTVIEINPASCSDARQILLQSLEATQSHRITSSGQKNGICSFFNVKENKKEEDEERSNTLILIDDADILPAGEESFLSAVDSMLLRTKRPVIFTISGNSNMSLLQGERLELGEVAFTRPSAVDICSYLSLLAVAESLQLDLSLAQEMTDRSNGDLRTSINLAQFWAGSEMRPDSANIHQSTSSADIHQSTDPRNFPVEPQHTDEGFSLEEENSSMKSSEMSTDSGVESLPSCTIEFDAREALFSLLDAICLNEESDLVCESSVDSFESQISNVPSDAFGSPPAYTNGDRVRRSPSPEYGPPVSRFSSPSSVKELLGHLNYLERQSSAAALKDSRTGQPEEFDFWKFRLNAGVDDSLSEDAVSVEDKTCVIVDAMESKAIYDSLISTKLQERILPFRSREWHRRDCEDRKFQIISAGTELFGSYGHLNPGIHVRGNIFGMDYWSFIRSIASSEALRRQEEELTKRRRLRFYHYLGARLLHLDDGLIDKLAYSMDDRHSNKA